MKDRKDSRKQVNFRLTDDEVLTIQQKANLACLSVSAYCKKMALDGRVKAPVITPDIARIILPEIAKIGSNINQVARKLNQNNQGVGGDKLLPYFHEMQEHFDSLWAYILEGKKPRKNDVLDKSLDDEKPLKPKCDLCGANLVEGRREDGSLIWFCPNYEMLHTVLERG